MLNCQPCRNPNCMFSRQILGEPGLVDYSERSELCEICDNREERLQDCIRSLALLWILDALAYKRALEVASGNFPDNNVKGLVKKHLQKTAPTRTVLPRKTLIAHSIDTLALSLRWLPVFRAKIKMNGLLMTAALHLLQARFSKDVISNIVSFLAGSTWRGTTPLEFLTSVKRESFCLSRHPACKHESGDSIEWVQARTYKNLVAVHAQELIVLRTTLLNLKEVALQCSAAANVKEIDKTLTAIKRILAEPTLKAPQFGHRHFQPLLSP